MASQKISKKDTFAEALKKNPLAAQTFSNAGMHCAGCPYASFESIEEGASAHGLNADEILAQIESLESKGIAGVDKKSKIKIKNPNHGKLEGIFKPQTGNKKSQQSSRGFTPSSSIKSKKPKNRKK